MIGSDGLLRVGGRLHHSSATDKNPIILHKASGFTFLLIRRLHLENSHAGPSVLMQRCTMFLLPSDSHDESLENVLFADVLMPRL